jgi:spermidine synthase
MTSPLSRPSNAVPFALFVLSGLCGLLYQIVWLRLAFAAFGVITPVLSVVVSVFMLGLSLGSWAAGAWIGRLTRATRIPAISFYALCEAFVGLGALAVPRLFAAGEKFLLGFGQSDSASYLGLSAAILALSILPWCICMGATYPLMLAFLRQAERSDDTSFSFLYLANVIGAMVGTLLTAGVLIELFGLRATVGIGAAINFLIAAIALAWGLRRPVSDTPAAATPRLAEEDAARPGAMLLFALLFVTGFISMAMEVVWTRAFTPIIKTSIYSFASILAVYLLATWIGSWRYRRDVRRDRVTPIAHVVALLSIFAFLPILNDPRLHTRMAVDVLLVWASLFPFCMALGYLTPQIIDRYAGGRARQVGSAYAFNIIGCILGPLAAGYLLLPSVGVRIALILLALPFLVFVLYFAARRALAPRRFAVTTAIAAVLLVVSMAVVWGYDDRGYVRDGVVRRDHTATIIAGGTGRGKYLFVNGISITWLSPVTKVMAHLPLVSLRRPPTSALTICFGMGTTFRSLATWPIQVRAAELVPSVKASFGYFFADADTIVKPPLREIVVDDGRRFLNRTSQKFDVITIDPPPPLPAAGSSLLYSTDFYDVIQRHLAPGGILQQWFPAGEERSLEAIVNALRARFRYVRVYHSILDAGYHFLCSQEPILVPDEASFIARLPEAARRDLVEWSGGVPLDRYVHEILKREVPIESLLPSGETAVLTDDRPFNEYFLLRRAANILRGTDRKVK